MNISGNTIFIPGSTSGIGLALALELQARGNTVIIGGRRADLLEQIAAEHPGIDTVEIDTADPASIDAAAKEVLARHPDLNVLITMAGIMRVEDWHQPEGVPGLGRVGHHHQRARPDPAHRRVHRAPAGPAGRHHHDRLLRPGVHPAGGHAELQRVQGRDPHAQRVDPAAVRRHDRQVVELVPPSVRTALVPGQENSEFAMPLDEFITEAMALLETQPDAKEIQVERVKFLRYGEARGDYDQVVATLNAADPHGK